MVLAGEISRFVEAYVEALRDDNAAVFAGAGLSIPAGMVDWAGLMEAIADDIGLRVDKEHDLISVAQFHVNERGGRHRINQTLITEFAERARLTENHKLLMSLPIRTFWTTNYDTLLEDALRHTDKRADVKTTDSTLAITLPRRNAIVYKMHGDISRPEEAVVTRDDYEEFSAKRPLLSAAFQGDLVSKTFLFIGFSFSDPNLSYLLSRIRILLGPNRRDHYCLLRRVQEMDFGSASEYDYARGRQDLQIRDLKRFGIHVLLLDSYEQYTEVLRLIVQRYRRSRVFVSGSAATYAPWTEDDAQDFIRKLGQRLIEEGFDVVTGFGIGVGAYLLNGILEGLRREGTSSIDDRVTLRPFPQGVHDPGERARRWHDYRRSMITTAGTALFVFGNRRDGELLRHAPGVREEYQIAREEGLAVLPIGATGYMAADLQLAVMGEVIPPIPGRPDLSSLIEKLAERTSNDTLISQVIEILSIFRAEA